MGLNIAVGKCDRDAREKNSAASARATLHRSLVVRDVLVTIMMTMIVESIAACDGASAGHVIFDAFERAIEHTTPTAHGAIAAVRIVGAAAHVHIAPHRGT